ncbi:MAG: hypothetical protein JXQ73_13040 [Phycisphaerae bacterium]|nr:hypothetical protein [Phycisphaerae bacterium]
MRRKRRAKVVWAIVIVAGAGALYIALAPDRDGFFPTTPPSSSKANPQSQPARTSLTVVNEFIRWYELQFVQRMRWVGSFSTDVNELVNELGLEKTLDRYVALREVNLEYALGHPNCRTIPAEDLERLARLQLEHILSNTRRSRTWIDYSSPKLREGAIESLKDTSLAWIPFYQKLLAGPPPSGGDLKANIRARVSRDEYVQTMERVTRTKASLHASMKDGIVWYASWLSWARTMVDKVGKQDLAACWATVDDIYGDATGTDKGVGQEPEAADAGAAAPSTTRSLRRM